MHSLKPASRRRPTGAATITAGSSSRPGRWKWLSLKAFGFDVPKERERSIGCGSYGSVMDALSYAVTRYPYLTGETFTAADVYVGAHISWGMQFGTLEPRVEFKAYWDRLKDRPACKRATAIDDEEMHRQLQAAKAD